MNPWRAEWRIMGAPMLLACAGLGAVTAAYVRDWTRVDSYSAGIDQLALSPWTMLVPLVAMALASVQGLADGDLDQRALGRMRAISDARQFLCKCLVGVSAYVISIGLPLLLVTIWHAWLLPRPFLPGMLCRPLLTMATGILCYFGVQCAFVSTGRWFQRASYPIAAIALSVMITGRFPYSNDLNEALTVPKAIEDMTCCLLAAGALIHTSWRLFRQNGDSHDDRTLWPLIPAGVTAVAIFPIVLWIQLDAGIQTSARDVRRYPFRNDGGVSIGSADARLQPLDPNTPSDRRLAADDTAALDSSISSSLNQGYDDDFRSSVEMNSTTDLDAGRRMLVYYTIPSRHEIRVLDWESGRPTPIPVPAGFPPFPLRFERSLFSSGLLIIAADGRPWHLDGSLVVTPKGPWSRGMPISVECQETFDRNQKIDMAKSRMLVLTATQILSYDFSGELMQERHLPFSLADAGPLHVADGDWFTLHFDWNPNHQVVLERSAQIGRFDALCWWIDARGTILSHRQLSLVTVSPTSMLLLANMMMQPPILGPDPLVPLSWYSWHTRVPHDSSFGHSGDAFAQSRSLHGRQWAGQAAVAVLCGALMAILAYRRSRQWSHVGAWLIFGVVFGAGGLVGYAVHHPSGGRQGASKQAGRSPPSTDRSSPAAVSHETRANIQIIDEAA